MTTTASTPCGTNDGGNTVTVIGTCCGVPEPTNGWNGTHVVLTTSVADATSGAQLDMYAQGVAGSALPAPSAGQRLYLFSYQVLVGAAGLIQLFENVDGDSTFPGAGARVAQGSLAQNGGLAQRLPNRITQLGRTLHVRHSVAGQVDVVVHGRLVTE